jgi:hypothetical protein
LEKTVVFQMPLEQPLDSMPKRRVRGACSIQKGRSLGRRWFIKRLDKYGLFAHNGRPLKTAAYTSNAIFMLQMRIDIGELWIGSTL